MENGNVLKTAVGVGILGTVAAYLGYSYFNEDSDSYWFLGFRFCRSI